MRHPNGYFQEDDHDHAPTHSHVHTHSQDGIHPSQRHYHTHAHTAFPHPHAHDAHDGAPPQPQPRVRLPSECAGTFLPDDGSVRVERAPTDLIAFRYVVGFGDKAESLAASGPDSLVLSTTKGILTLFDTDAAAFTDPSTGVVDTRRREMAVAEAAVNAAARWSFLSPAADAAGDAGAIAPPPTSGSTSGGADGDTGSTVNTITAGTSTRAIATAVAAAEAAGTVAPRAYIRRESTRPTTDALLNLTEASHTGRWWEGGQSGNAITINTTAVRVGSVKCVAVNSVALAPDADITARVDDQLLFTVTFDRAVMLLDGEGREVTWVDTAPLAAGSEFGAAGDGASDTQFSEESQSGATTSTRWYSGCGGARGSELVTLSLATAPNLAYDGEGDVAGYGGTANLTKRVRMARYLNGSGTNTLSFVYHVRSSDKAVGLDYTNTTALSVNGGALLVAISTMPTKGTVDLALPLPGQHGSISATQNVSLVPTLRNQTRVEMLTSSVPEGCYPPGTRITVGVWFSRCVAWRSEVGLRLQLDTDDRANK